MFTSHSKESADILGTHGIRCVFIGAVRLKRRWSNARAYTRPRRPCVVTLSWSHGLTKPWSNERRRRRCWTTLCGYAGARPPFLRIFFFFVYSFISRRDALSILDKSQKAGLTANNLLALPAYLQQPTLLYICLNLRTRVHTCVTEHTNIRDSRKYLNTYDRKLWCSYTLYKKRWNFINIAYRDYIGQT